MDTILDALNPRQREAVTTTEGFVRIVAGAGSGKTKALTHRYAYLVKTGGIHPRNILCVTFTSKAAGEMRRRVRQLVGEGYDTSLITTYHGFCARVLRPDMDRLFYPQNFTILDTSDQKKILEEIYETLELKLDHASFEKILGQIGLRKGNTDYVRDLVDPARTIDPSNTATLDDKIIAMYLQRQKKIYGLDFDDLINFTFYLFAQHPDVKEKWQTQLLYIQVDEFQDSSRREMQLLDILDAQNQNLFVVGDPDQTIYEWRGARVEILVDFDKNHSDVQTIILNQNYRSTPQVLAVANSLIEKNTVRIKKDLFTENPNGPAVVHLHAKDERAEGEWIVREIKHAIAEEQRKYSDIAILYRASFLSRYLEQALLEGDIPYQIWGGVRFFDRMEIKDMLAYLRLAAYQDDMSLLRVINVPRRQIGKAKLTYLRACADTEHTSLYEALRKHCHDKALRYSGAESFLTMIDSFHEQAETMPPSELLQTILRESGYERYIRENGDMERLDNLAELMKTVTDYERIYGEALSLTDYLRQIELQSGDDTEDSRDCVRLMTIHASKGLEFPCVFVAGFTEGIFPSSRTLEERKLAGLEEERRLCFVAMTRSRERLYLTESEGTGTGGARKCPSRFLFDVADGLYERVGVIPQDLIDEVRKKHISTPGPIVPRLANGTRVNHPFFGEGVVQSADEAHGVYHVRFDKTGKTKPISMDFTFGAVNAPNTTSGHSEPDTLKDAWSDAQPVTTPTPVPTPPPVAPPDAGPNLWKRADVPHEGWHCESIYDLGAPNGLCGMCGYQTIRYVHVMTHPAYPSKVGAGRVCAGRMEGNPEQAAQREKAFKNTQARREKFMGRTWKTSAKGNLYTKYKNNLIILLADKYKDGYWKYLLNGALSGLFPSREAAQLDAFEAVQKALDSVSKS